MLTLILTAVIVIGVFLAWRYRRQLAEQRLRENPPQRRVIEVSLPRGIADARERMGRFYRKVASAALVDDAARRKGAGQVDFVYLASVPQPGAAAHLTTLIYADEDKMDAIKRAIKADFESMADVIELEEDPLAPFVEAFKPRPDELGAEAELAEPSPPA